MFKSMLDDKKEKLWIGFHALMGVLCAFSKIPLVFWYYALLVSTLVTLFAKKNKDYVLIHLLVYTLGVEQIGRSISTAPLIPYEIGKYLTFSVLVLCLFYPNTHKTKSSIGQILLFFTIPAFLILPATVKFSDIAFNYFGVLNIGMGLIYFTKQKVSYSQFLGFCKILIYPVITFGIFLIIKTGQAEKVTYGLNANFETSGGSATNQVATILGFAFAIIALFFLTNQQVFKTKFVDIILLFFFLFRGLLTLSRGGVVSAIIAVLLVVLIPKLKRAYANRQIVFRNIQPKYYLFSAVFMVGTFLFVNSLTGNFLLLRYEGHTQKTLRTGVRDLNSLTSDRWNILLTDLEIFDQHTLFGVGIGQSRYYRGEFGLGQNGGVLPHVEVSRMLSEHGIFGIVLIAIFLFYPVYKISKTNNNYQRAVMIVFFTISVTSTFHSAMRTMIAPLAFGLACLHLVPDSELNNNLSKQNTRKAQPTTA